MVPGGPRQPAGSAKADDPPSAEQSFVGCYGLEERITQLRWVVSTAFYYEAVDVIGTAQALRDAAGLVTEVWDASCGRTRVAYAMAEYATEVDD